MASPFVELLESQLRSQIEVELAVTMQVAVLLAAKISKREIAERLGIDNAELTMCVRRLEGVTAKWS